MEKKYVVDTRKHKKENAEMKIQLRAKKTKQAELSTKHQALQSVFQYLQQDFQDKEDILLPFARNTVDTVHTKKSWLVICGWSTKIGEFSLMEGNSTTTT